MFECFCWIFENNCPGGVLARFFCPRVGFRNFFVPGAGEFALSKIPLGFARGGGGEGWSSLELTDTLPLYFSS